VIVSSGAVACGRDVLQLKNGLDDVTSRQVFASIGQIRLIEKYEEFFESANQLCAQVLPTKEDFRSRRHYLNIKNCFEGLLNEDIIPIVNENDVISVHQLMFTDNDELAGLIAAMINADALCILTNVDGLLDGSPSDPTAQVIPLIEPDDRKWQQYVFHDEKSENGRGGMYTKCSVARKLCNMGIETHIVSGRSEGVLTDIAEGKNPGTLFTAKARMTSTKRWIGICEGQEKGIAYVNAGAARALTDTSTATSLLPIGIVSVEGDFRKGDVIKICTDRGAELGMGMAQYGSHEAKEVVGKKGEKPLVHYDYLYLSE
jgi:glutamate 5-kinase